MKEVRPLCECGSLAKRNGKNVDGTSRFKKLCNQCECRKYNLRGHGYKMHKLKCCQICNFIAERSCQMDVDHIDGDHKNDKLENLQTLCANCHRLKSQMDRERK